MKKTLVVMAAGMGSRFGGLKQVEPVGPNNEFIIDYSVFDAKKAGFTKVVFVIKKELESTFKETIGKRLEDKIEVDYAYQEINDIPASKKYLADKRLKPWGTLQAVLCAKNQVPGDFVVINADDFYGVDSYFQASKFLDTEKNNNVYASICFPYIVTSSKYGSVKRAVCITNEDNITELIESKMTTLENRVLCEPLNGDESFYVPLDQPVSVNMFVFKHDFFNDLENYFNNYFKQSDENILKNEILLPELVKEKVKNKEIVLKKITSNSRWFGMTFKEDLPELKANINNLIENGVYPSKL